MTIYMIGHDLHLSDKENYDEFFMALEAIGNTYWDCLESVWLITTEKTAVQIREELKPFLKEGDRFLIMRYGSDAAWLGFDGECRIWLEDNL